MGAEGGLRTEDGHNVYYSLAKPVFAHLGNVECPLLCSQNTTGPCLQPSASIASPLTHITPDPF